MGATLRLVPVGVLIWLVGERMPLGARAAGLARREGLRRWAAGRRVHNQFIPF